METEQKTANDKSGFLTADDLSMVYEIKVNVYDIHNQVIKSVSLDSFSSLELANTFIKEYCKRVEGWEVESKVESNLDGDHVVVESCMKNPDGTMTRMFIHPKTVFNNWDAYVNEYAKDLRLCDLNF